MVDFHAIIFDLGKVLVDFDYGIAARRLQKRATCTAEELVRLINQSPLLLQYENGDLSTAQFYEEIRRATGYQGGREEFDDLFGGIFTEIPAMTRLHEDLVALGYKTYIFSNTNELAVRHIDRHFPFFRRFAGHIYSYECKSMKPKPSIYEAMEHLAGCRGGQMVYIDDRPENIEAGRARGWKGIIHEDPNKTRAFLMEIGILDQ